MEEFLKEIGINEFGHMENNGSYVIDFGDESDWSKAQSKLDKSDLVDEDQEVSLVSMAGIHVQYIAANYIIDMVADFESDTYKLVIKEN